MTEHVGFALWKFSASKKQVRAYHLYSDCALLKTRDEDEVVAVTVLVARERELTECGICRKRKLRELTSSTSKRCGECLEEKPVEMFYRSKKSDYQLYCKICSRNRLRAWKARTDDEREQARISKLKKGRRTQRLKSYGLTPEEYDQRVKAQDGKCAACGQLPGVKGLQIDHDHQFQTVVAVRDLLCGPCNMALGQLGDDLERIQMLYNYKMKWEEALWFTDWPFSDENGDEYAAS